jgi:hypothetical protein
VVPMTCCSWRATGEALAFRGDRFAGLNVVGLEVEVVRIADGGPFNLVRRLYVLVDIFHMPSAGPMRAVGRRQRASG